MIATFFQGQMDYILFLSGLAFMLLSPVCFLIRDKTKYPLSWISLGLFGIISGLYEWQEMIVLSTGDTPAFSIIRLCFLTVAYIFLLEFGRIGTPKHTGKVLGIWVFIPLLLFATLGIWVGTPGLIATTHYALGMVGGFWATLAFLRTFKNTGSRPLIVASMGMAFYSLVTGLMVPKAPFFPASALNHESFYATINLPIHLVQMVLAILITCAVWNYYRVCSRFNVLKGTIKTFQERWLFLLILAILIGGLIATNIVGNNTTKTMQSNLISRTTLAVSVLDATIISRLTGSPKDVDTPDYITIKHKLSKMRQSNADLRFIYLMTMKDENVVFLADSEPDNSKDSSPPGQVYSDASPELLAAFRSCTTFLEGPLPDAWGVWISGFVPVLEPYSHRLLGMFGMDIDARDWQQQIYNDRIVPIIITLLVFMLVTFYFFDQQRMWLRAQQALRYQAVLLELAKANTTDLKWKWSASASGGTAKTDQKLFVMIFT
jgi:hypothetical protein